MTVAPIHVSYSELDAFWQCPTKWRWGYKEKWNTEASSPALARGTVWHAMLQTHYEMGRQLKNPSEHAVQIKAAVMDTMVTGDLDDEQMDLLTWMYDGYAELYGHDGEYDILATEINRTIPLPLPSDPTQPGAYALKVKIDMVTKNRRTGQVLAWDHKTASDFTPIERLMWRPQFPLYTWALRAAKLNVQGFIVNSARTKRNKGSMSDDQRFKRNFLIYTDRQLVDAATNASRTAYAMHDPERVEYSAPRDLAMGGCTWCDFSKPHAQIIRGADEEQALTDFGFVQGYRR